MNFLTVKSKTVFKTLRRSVPPLLCSKLLIHAPTGCSLQTATGCFLNRSPRPQEFFTACGLKIYSGFPRTGQADFAGAENAAGKLPSPTPQTTLFYFGIENRSKLQNRSFNYFFSVKSPIEIIACLQKKPCMNTKSLNQLKPC
jgi:hypothetical protein